jgi:hypothetical protein
MKKELQLRNSFQSFFQKVVGCSSALPTGQKYKIN